MTTETFPDVEGAVVTLLRTHTAVTAVCGARTFFGVPKTPTWPLNTVKRVGGGEDPATDVPLDVALIQIDCWGEIDAVSGFGKKAQCTTQVRAVRTALASIEGTTAGTDLAGITVQSVIWLPDPDNDRPRYSVTAEVTALSS